MCDVDFICIIYDVWIRLHETNLLLARKFSRDAAANRNSKVPGKKMRGKTSSPRDEEEKKRGVQENDEVVTAGQSEAGGGRDVSDTK